MIGENSNFNSNSYSSIGGAYTGYEYNATYGPYLLGGTRNFVVNEIEVYLRFD